MALPDVTTTIQDGALGITAGTADIQSATLGICEKGTVGTVYSFSDPQAAYDELGEGPLTEAVALKLAVTGGTHYAVPLTPLFDGAASASVTKVGTGAGTISVGFGPKQQITVLCSTGGALATAAFQFKIGSGAYSAPVTSAAGWATNYQVVGTLTRLVFGEGTGYDAGDTFTVSTTGTITQTVNAGSGTGTISSQNSQPLDDYDVKIYISKAGAVGAGEFRWSVDGGNYDIDSMSTDGNGDKATGIYSSSILIPSGTKYAIPNTGIVLTFANGGGQFDLGDFHSFITVASGFNASAVTTGFNTLFANTTALYDIAHIAGTPTSAANAASLASTADSSMTTAETTHKRYLHTVMQVPSSLGGGTIILSGGNAVRDSADTDSTIVTAFASTTSRRVAAVVGDGAIISVISARALRRNMSWIEVARKCAIARSQNASEIRLGGLPYVKTIFRDERTAATSLDAVRFTTARTVISKVGYYFTRGLTLADSTSDFARQANRMVMDRACALAYSVLLEEVEARRRVNPNGTILAGDAGEIESSVRKAIDDELLASGDVSGESVVSIDRTNNVLSTATLKATIRILPNGYSTHIESTIGFVNPNIAAAA